VREYGQVGGWEFDPAGAVRPLTSTVAFALVPDESATAAVSGGVSASRCRWCDLPLWRLLDVDLSTARLINAALVTPARIPNRQSRYAPAHRRQPSSA
jgi:hypothetical protein